MPTDDRKHVGRSLQEVLSEKLRERSFAERFEAAGTTLRLVEQVREIMGRQELAKSELARRMGTSVSQVARLLNVEYEQHVSLSTLLRFAAVTGHTLQVRFLPSVWVMSAGEAASSARARMENAWARLQLLSEEANALRSDLELVMVWSKTGVEKQVDSEKVPVVHDLCAAKATAQACGLLAMAGA